MGWLIALGALAIVAVVVIAGFVVYVNIKATNRDT